MTYPALMVLLLLGAGATHLRRSESATEPVHCPKTSTRGAAAVNFATRHGLLDSAGFKIAAHQSAIPVKDGQRCTQLEHYYAGSPFAAPKWHREYFALDTLIIVSLYYAAASRTDVHRGHLAVFAPDLTFRAVIDNPLGAVPR